MSEPRSRAESNASVDELSTLDEPVSETIKRDVLMVGSKFLQVLVPKMRTKRLLHDWDLWGPLLLCVTLAMLLRDTAREDQRSLVFSGVFVIVWCGAAVVTVNSKLLGGTLSFFQSVCVLGYCILPLTLASIITKVIPSSMPGYAAVKIVVCLVSCVWSVWASIGFLGDSQPLQRKALAVYPICLFYVVIAWLVAVQSA